MAEEPKKRARDIDAAVEAAVRGAPVAAVAPKPAAVKPPAVPSRRSPEELARIRAEAAAQNARDLEREKQIEQLRRAQSNPGN